MKTLANVFEYIIEEVNDLKKNGVSFVWQNIDLSELLISDLISAERSMQQINRLKLSTVLKMKLSTVKKRFSYNSKSTPLNGTILVFVNELNQWENIEPVVNILITKGIKIDVISTKGNILNTLNTDISSVKYIKGYHFPVGQLLRNTRNHKMVTLINNNIPKISYLFSEFNKILSNSNYKYVMIGNDITSDGKLLSILSNRKNIRSGSIQHGSMNRVNPINGYSRVNDFFVFGKTSARELVYLGISKDNVAVSGWPMQQQFKNNLTKAKSAKSVVRGADILVCLSGPGHSVSETLHNTIIELIARLQRELDLDVIVKLHPKDKKEYYSTLLENKTTIYDNTSLLEMSSSLLELFTKVNCTITVASTAALESLLAETPVVTIDIDKSFNDVDYIQDGLTFHSTNYTELKQQFEKISNGNKSDLWYEMKNKIEDYYHKYFDENYNPSGYIANKILEVCAE